MRVPKISSSRRFENFALNQIGRRNPAVCNTTKNKFLAKFLKGNLKIWKSFQENPFMKFWRNSVVEFFFIEAGANMLSARQNNCSKKRFEKLSGFLLGISSVNLTRKLRFGHIYWRNPEWKTSIFCEVSALKKDSLLSTMDVLGSFQIYSGQLLLLKHYWTDASKNSNSLFSTTLTETPGWINRKS